MAETNSTHIQKPTPKGGGFLLPEYDYADWKADFADKALYLRNHLFSIGEII